MNQKRVVVFCRLKNQRNERCNIPTREPPEYGNINIFRNPSLKSIDNMFTCTNESRSCGILVKYVIFTTESLNLDLRVFCTSSDVMTMYNPTKIQWNLYGVDQVLEKKKVSFGSYLRWIVYELHI